MQVKLAMVDQSVHPCVFGGKQTKLVQVKLAMVDQSVHPCVLARLEVSPDLPTLVFYGHYDVQPALELVRYCCVSLIKSLRCKRCASDTHPCWVVFVVPYSLFGPSKRRMSIAAVQR